VSNGCRAEFRILGRRGGRYNYNDRNRNNDRRGNTSYVANSGQVIHCDSTGDGRIYCHSEANRRFRLNRARYGNCVEGQTWGMDDHGLWVSGGCRADFNYQN
jgi:Lon protease-like protein